MASRQRTWWAVLALLALLALRFVLFERNRAYLETATIPLVLGAIAVALGGWHLVGVAWPAIVFLFLMLPLPRQINYLSGQPASATGNDRERQPTSNAGDPRAG